MLILYENGSQWMLLLSGVGISRRRMSFNFTGLQNKERGKGHRALLGENYNNLREITLIF